MAKNEVDKISAARRQISAAIRMLFSDEDPLAIHTVVSAGFRILKDLAQIQDSEVLEMFNLSFRPGRKEKYWRVEVSYMANFLKHADKDPDHVLKKFEERVNDHLIFFGCELYRDIVPRDKVQKLTFEMAAFTEWYAEMYPNSLVYIPDDLRRSQKTAFVRMSALSRPEQLAQGHLKLESWESFRPSTRTRGGWEA